MSTAFRLEDELDDDGVCEALRWLESPIGPANDSRRPRRVHHSRLGRRYWTLWTATGISGFGDGLVVVALPLLAAGITRNPIALGGVLAASRLPWLFVALPLGALADRCNRRRMAVVTEVSRAALLLALAVLVAAGMRQLWVVYLAALLLGVFEASFVAATSSAVPDLVSKRRLASANGHLSAVNVAADDFIGVGVGGLLFAAFAALPFLLDGLTFVASALLVLAALPRSVPKALSDGIRGKARRDVRDGLAYLRQSPALRLLMGANVALAFFQAVVVGLLVPFGLGPLHLSQGSYGVVLGLASIGAVAGGAWSGTAFARFGGARVVIVGGLAGAAGFIALARTSSLATACLVWGAELFCVMVTRTAIMTLRQERVPDDMQARTNTAFRAVVYGVVPLGAVLGGAVATALSLRWAIGLAGAAQFVVLLAMALPVLRALEGTIDLRVPEEAIDLTSRIAGYVGAAPGDEVVAVP